MREGFWEAIESLIAHLNAKVLRAELRRINRTLVPDTKPKNDYEEAYQAARPQLALKALEIACSVRRCEHHRDWITPLIDQIAQDAGRLERVLDDLERRILRTPIVQKLFKLIDELESFLTPQALEEPRGKVRAGQSISDWLASLTTGLDKWDHLIALARWA